MSEPRWTIERQNYDFDIGVAAFWPDGTRHAAVCYEVGRESRQVVRKAVELAKRKLLAWYDKRLRLRLRRRLLLV